MNTLGQLPRQVQFLGGVAVAVAGLVLAMNRPGGWSIALLGGLFVLAAWVRPASSEPRPANLRLVEKQQIGRDTGVVLVWAEGQPLLVAYGPAGVQVQRLEPRGQVEVQHGC